MPTSWQITEARAYQTQGVWALVDTFTVRGQGKYDHSDMISTLGAAAVTTEDAKNVLGT